MRRFLLMAATGGSAIALALSGAPATGAASGDGDAFKQTRADREKLAQIALPAGLQVARKHTKRPTIVVHGKRVNAPNPFLANVPDPARVDWSYWSRLAMRQGKSRAAVGRAPAPFLYDEQEPAGDFGSNDGLANAEQIAKFGLDSGEKQAVRIQGQLSPPELLTDDLGTEEDQGSIPLATETGVPEDTDGVFVESEIGDGPFGSEEAGSGDFDFFHVTASVGQVIRGTTAGSDFDTILLVYDADGNIVASNDDANGTLQSEVAYSVTADGDYYMLVTGFLSLPEDPFDSSSGLGADAEGAYQLELTVGPTDLDYYAVRLDKGDVLGGSIAGDASDVQVWRPNGAPRILSEFADASFIYPMASPLPGADGANTSFAYVAERGGWYAVSTSQGDGEYRMGLEVYRPGAETAGSGAVQKVFLDFNGERVNTGGVFGGFGVVTLSPLSAFLGRWGLPTSNLNAVIDGVIATVKQNIHDDLVARGINDDLQVKVLNSRDNPNAWGKPNTTRVIVGGTIAQSGIPTIGIAQSIDPGNYAHEETGLVLLDILSDPDTGDDASLNAYLTGDSDKLAFIEQALGNVVSHEIGHMLGNFHVDQFNDVLNLMDQGGNFPLLYGVGDDGVGGTDDDPDVNFGTDTYNPNEGFAGLENTLNTSAWALSAGQ